MMASYEERNRRIVGAWHSKPGVTKGSTGLQIVWLDEHGTAHAGDFRKSWNVPDDVKPTPDSKPKASNMTTPKPAAVPKEVRLSYLNGALLKAPVYEDHYRGSNWLAVIDVDGTCPGGLSRQFMPYGKGECLYLIEQIGLFSAVEFAADYTTSVGKKKPNRFYGVVIAITETELVVREFTSGADACVFAKKARTSPEDKIRALEEARGALLAKAAKVEEEMAALKGASQVPT